MFLLVPAYPGCPGSKAVKRLLLLLLFSSESRQSYWQDNSAISALMLLVGRQERHLACKLSGGGAGMVICLE